MKIVYDRDKSFLNTLQLRILRINTPVHGDVLI